MTTYEFTGRSVKEAIAKACEELKTDVNLLEVEVLEESARGFLGIVGHRDARIRVRKRDIDMVTEMTEMDESPEMASDELGTLSETIADSDVENLHDACSASDLSDEEEGVISSCLNPSDYVEKAREILVGILQRIPVEAEVKGSVMNGAVYLDIKGDGSGLLIGKKGQTLDALQFLVSKILNKTNRGESRVEIIVDSENYRMRRRETLRETALRTSEKAKRTLKPVSLSPMPAYERRIIHLLLAEDRDVYTKSYGEGPVRRIIVFPRKGMVNKRRRR